MAKRSSAARKLARDLQIELEAHGEAHGVSLSWSVPELAIIEQIQDQIDRKQQVMAAYDAATDDKTRLKFSAEARLLEGSIGRLLKLINTTPAIKTAPPRRNIYDEQASRHGRKAANARWSRRGNTA